MVLPLAWLKRVGLSHVSYERRVILRSSAERIRNHGFPAAPAVADSDMRNFVPGRWRPRIYSLIYLDTASATISRKQRALCSSKNQITGGHTSMFLSPLGMSCTQKFSAEFLH